MSRSNAAARAIGERVARLTPPGIPWVEIEERVARYAPALDAALRRYEEEDTPEARGELLEAAAAWTAAWERAVEAWRQAGRPTAEELEKEYWRDERVGMITDAPLRGSSNSGRVA